MYQKDFLELGHGVPIAIILEEPSFIVANKPAGQLFHGYTTGQPSTLVDQVKNHIMLSRQKPGNVYLGVSHRLDRPVSGLSIFGLNSKVSTRIAEQFQDRSIEKIYLSVVEGIVAPSSARLEDTFVFEDSHSNKATEKKCYLDYQVLVQDPEAMLSLIAIKLGTGRRHQIRMQFSKRSWPVVGDCSYGARTHFAGSEHLDPRFAVIGLHAAYLRLKHPLSYQPLSLCAPLPFYWQNLPPLIRSAAQAFIDAPLALSFNNPISPRVSEYA